MASDKVNILSLRKKTIAFLIAVITIATGASYHDYVKSSSDDIASYTTSSVDDSIIRDYNNENKNNYSYMRTNDLEDTYNVATKEIADFLDKMDFDNDIQYFYAFYVCFNNGLFSESDNIAFEPDGVFIDDLKALGMDSIIDADNNGDVNSLCRHRDTLFNDVVNKSKMNFEAYSTPCRILDEETDYSVNNPDHQITVINYDGDTRYYDVTNGIVCDVYESNDFVSSENGEVKYKILAEYSSIDKKKITKHNSNKEIKRINDLVKNDDETTKESLITSECEKAYSKLIKNQKLINKFKTKYQDDVIDKLSLIKNK